MDTITPEQRSRNMAAIKGKDTKPEMTVRKYLFSRGLRYRVNNRKLPGTPDIVLKKYKTAIFINGCFWHGHDSCKYYRLPKSNVEFWQTKIDRNKARDISTDAELAAMGWRVIRLWECEIKTKANRDARLERLYHEITREGIPNQYESVQDDESLAAEPHEPYGG